MLLIRTFSLVGSSTLLITGRVMGSNPSRPTDFRSKTKMIHTVYSLLTDSEFMSELETRQGKSPIIDECIKRLAGLYKVEECPVCGANLGDGRE